MKYEMQVNKNSVIEEFDKLINRIFKLLPEREEGKEWQTPLRNLIVEIVGLNNLFLDELDLLPIIARLEGLMSLDKEDDFFIFRSNIFECCSLISKVKNQWD